MRIIGFNLLKQSVEREEKFEGKPKVNQTIDIKDVIKEKIPISDSDALKFHFVLVLDYGKSFGKIEFEGNVLTMPENEELKDILKEWKSKKLPESMRIGLFNFIMNKCNVKALQLEDELGFPLHIPFPRFGLKKD